MAKKVKKTTKKKATTKKVAKKKTVKKAAAKKKAVKKTVKKAAKASSAKKATKKKTAAKKKTTIKKKAVAKKKTSASETKPQPKPRKKVSRKRKSVLSKKELIHFRQLLVDKLKEITGDVNQIETEALKTSLLDASGNLSSMPIHMADIGSDNYEQEFALGLMDSERKIVQEIYAALNRLVEGTYGICEGTGEPIPTLRLEGIPWTRYCIQYAEMIEKGLVVEGERLYDDQEDDELDDDYDMYAADDEDNDDEDESMFYGYDDDDDDI